nr:sodium:proton antiporter [Rhizobium halophytocola]
MAFQIGLIGVMGIGAQWLAWKVQIPAIVVLVVAGLIAGPCTGLIAPDQIFGDLLRPMIGLAVAIILFEGGLTLEFAQIRETSAAVRRLVLFGSPLTWGLTFLAAHYVAGLQAPTAAVFSGILVVTGPTVIMPMLRQARLPSRPASLLRWEAILADPLGALFAVFAFEIVQILHGDHGSSAAFALRVGLAVCLAFALGIGLGRLLIWSFIRGHVPEYLKAAVLLITVLVSFELTNLVLEEAGLLTVTLLGVVIANSNIASFNEIRRFKEIMTVLLVSGVFVILTATITIADLLTIGWRDIAFVALMLFVIRPIIVLLMTVGTAMPLNERLLCAWIAPRGVVAIAVSGLFAAALMDIGFADGGRLVALAFLVVAVTVVLHGFSIRPVARLLKITRKEPDGILIVGCSPFAIALARRARELEIPSLIADRNWHALKPARDAGIGVYFGEILGETAEHKIDFSRFTYLIAATDNDDYNSLLCTDFGPELGRSNVFQIGRHTSTAHDRYAMPSTIGGRALFRDNDSFDGLQARIQSGWAFHKTRISAEYPYEMFEAERSERLDILFVLKKSGRLAFASGKSQLRPEAGDVIIAFGQAVRKAQETEAAPTP